MDNLLTLQQFEILTSKHAGTGRTSKMIDKAINHAINNPLVDVYIVAFNRTHKDDLSKRLAVKMTGFSLNNIKVVTKHQTEIHSFQTYLTHNKTKVFYDHEVLAARLASVAKHLYVFN
jgi:hypothetical protein